MALGRLQENETMQMNSNSDRSNPFDATALEMEYQDSKQLNKLKKKKSFS